VIVADTGIVVALIDADDADHQMAKRLFEDGAQDWVLPWAILAEVDYLLGAHVGAAAERAFLKDIAEERFTVVWGEAVDLTRARVIDEKYKSLRLGLVDTVVIAIAERLEASAIATLDVKHFGAVEIRGEPKLLPRDA
jgi:hypothetical protein